MAWWPSSLRNVRCFPRAHRFGIDPMLLFIHFRVVDAYFPDTNDLRGQRLSVFCLFIFSAFRCLMAKQCD